MRTFPLRIGTTDGLLFEGEVERVVCRTMTGDLAILAGHCNFCTALGMGEVQVRKDLAAVSSGGKPKVGYHRESLIDDIEQFLGYDNTHHAVLVGAGKLGRALLDYDGFEEFGIKILAGFDRNKDAIHTSNHKSVFSIQGLAQYCAEHDVKVGIITVGQGSAQEVCDRLVACGIQAIWNFAPSSGKRSSP